jgi:hypothetical protein
VKAIDGAYFYTICEFAADAGFKNNIGHRRLPLVAGGCAIVERYCMESSGQRKWKPLKQGEWHKTKWYPYGDAGQLMQYMGQDFEIFLNKRNVKYCNL